VYTSIETYPGGSFTGYYTYDVHALRSAGYTVVTNTEDVVSCRPTTTATLPPSPTGSLCVAHGDHCKSSFWVRCVSRENKQLTPLQGIANRTPRRPLRHLRRLPASRTATTGTALLVSLSRLLRQARALLLRLRRVLACRTATTGTAPLASLSRLLRQARALLLRLRRVPAYYTVITGTAPLAFPNQAFCRQSRLPMALAQGVLPTGIIGTAPLAFPNQPLHRARALLLRIRRAPACRMAITGTAPLAFPSQPLRHQVILRMAQVKLTMAPAQGAWPMATIGAVPLVSLSRLLRPRRLTIVPAQSV
jgi:hypothetical protein